MAFKFLSLYRLTRALWISAAILSLFVMGAAFAQTPEQFTVGRAVKFAAGTDNMRAQLNRTPAAREIVAGDFAVAQEDFDDDGRPEFILVARSAALCRGGGCALLILHKTANGIEPLFVQKVSGNLALTKERVDGYHALAVLDGSGQIAVGNRSGSPLFGKQVVYPVRPRTLEQTGKAAAESPPAKDAAEARVARASLEMVELIGMFMQPKDGPAALDGWTFGAQPGSPIDWLTSGIQESTAAERKAGYPYRRTGEAVLTIDGKPTHKVLGKNLAPGRWTITLSGPRGGFTRATISAPNSQELGPSVLEGLKGKLPLRPYRCTTPSISSGNKVYQVEGKGKKPFWINEEWSCGSAGCGISLDIVFTKKVADKFECF